MVIVNKFIVMDLERCSRRLSAQALETDPSGSSEDESFRDESWKAEDAEWKCRVLKKYITFRWSSGCAGAKGQYCGIITGYFSESQRASSKENMITGYNTSQKNSAFRRVDFLVIRVEDEEDAYKLGKDIRKFELFADRARTIKIESWNSKDGWTALKEGSKNAMFVSRSRSPRIVDYDRQGENTSKDCAIAENAHNTLGSAASAVSDGTTIRKPGLRAAHMFLQHKKANKPSSSALMVSQRFLLENTGVQVFTSHRPGSVAATLPGFCFYRAGCAFLRQN